MVCAQSGFMAEWTFEALSGKRLGVNMFQWITIKWHVWYLTLCTSIAQKAPISSNSHDTAEQGFAARDFT